MEQNIIITNSDEIKTLLKDAIREYNKEISKDNIVLFSIHQVAKMLKRSDRTIKRLVSSGVIITTKDNLITKEALESYLKNS